MWLFAGLGNPGSDYQNNRHNVGFKAVERIADRHSFSGFKKRFQGELAEGRLGTEKVLLLKPQTFMNKSGQSIGEAMRFYKLSPDQVVVFYDELDLAPFKVKVRLGGGAAGHNGIRSTIAHIGEDFWRVRIGIGHPGDKARVHGYVLGNYAKSEETPLEDLLDGMAAEAEWLAKGDGPRFMTELARRTQDERPKPAMDVEKAKARAEKQAEKAARTAASQKEQDSKGPMADALKGHFKKDGEV